MAKPMRTAMVEEYYVVSSPKNTTRGRTRRWSIEGGPHCLSDAMIVYEERTTRLRHTGLDILLVRRTSSMELVALEGKGR